MNISILLDFYGDMLTDKQREAMDYYYNDDLSLLEIAQNMDISRQGARDFIKRGEKQLADMENTLALAKRFAKLKAQADELDKAIADIKRSEYGGELGGEIARLEEIAYNIRKNL